jgi:hypothetical protein
MNFLVISWTADLNLFTPTVTYGHPTPRIVGKSKHPIRSDDFDGEDANTYGF